MWMQQPAPPPPTRDYFVYVASESADRVALVRFGPRGIKIERERYVGSIPNEIAGPHGVAVSPDGKHYFVTTAHGMPFGYPAEVQHGHRFSRRQRRARKFSRDRASVAERILRLRVEFQPARRHGAVERVGRCVRTR